MIPLRTMLIVFYLLITAVISLVFLVKDFESLAGYVITGMAVGLIILLKEYAKINKKNPAETGL
jgi:hypothetical protein